MKFVIAIDGGVATGKSTVAQIVAQELGFMHINTGAIYRCITLLSLENKLDLNKDVDMMAEIAKKIKIDFRIEDGLAKVYLNNHDVTSESRTPEISRNVSLVARHEKIRKVILKLQRAFAQTQDIVMEGRDIGTIIFPKATLKIFLTASSDVRAQRRLLEYAAMGKDISLDDVKEEITKRDHQDIHRDYAPLVKADDAVEIDNTTMTREEVIEKIVVLAKERM